jgi:thioredoxin-related protein
MKKIFIILLTFIVFSTPTLAFATDEEDNLNVVVDAALVRPLGLVSIVLGASLFIVSLPFTAISGNIDKSTKVLIIEPIDFTFKRPLGDFDNKTDKYRYK